MAHTDPALAALEAEIGELKTVRQSVEALLERLFAEFESAKDDPAQIQALVDKARAEREALSASVVKNTPSAGEPTPPPPPPSARRR